MFVPTWFLPESACFHPIIIFFNVTALTIKTAGWEIFYYKSIDFLTAMNY